MYDYGIVSSTSIMANMPVFDESVLLLKDNTGLGIGIHINITEGNPLIKDSSLSDENGNFHSVHDFRKLARLNQEDIYNEIKDQIEKILGSGLQPTHIDNHHFIHKFKNIREVLYKVAIEYSLPLRTTDDTHRFEARKLGITTPDFLIDNFYKENATSKSLEITISKLPQSIVTEIMTHPGYMDEETLGMTEYNWGRENEYKELKKFKKSVIFEKLQLITYKDLSA